MKLRAQRKMLKGKPRWYLVSSYRDKNTGKPRTRHHLYLGVPPNAKIEELIARINESQKYGKQFHTGKEFQKIREINLRARHEEKLKQWEIEWRANKAKEQEKNAPLRHQNRLCQRREIYALKKKLKPGERLISREARLFGAVREFENRLTKVSIDMHNRMIFEYGKPERWRPDLKAKVLEQFKWVEGLKKAIRDSRALRTPMQIGKRLPLDKARKISGFALIFSRLMAAKIALLDAIQAEGQPSTWSDWAKQGLEREINWVDEILNRLKS